MHAWPSPVFIPLGKLKTKMHIFYSLTSDSQDKTEVSSTSLFCQRDGHFVRTISFPFISPFFPFRFFLNLNFFFIISFKLLVLSNSIEIDTTVVETGDAWEAL